MTTAEKIQTEWRLDAPRVFRLVRPEKHVVSRVYRRRMISDDERKVWLRLHDGAARLRKRAAQGERIDPKKISFEENVLLILANDSEERLYQILGWDREDPVWGPSAREALLKGLKKARGKNQ